MRTRSLGLGSAELIQGDNMYGYYGKYQGIATPNELIALAEITQGITKADEYNNPNEDITWLKFSHNYKTLFVADRTIHYSVSWNHLDSKRLVFGKVVDIDGQKYLLRLLQGANENPSSVGGGANNNDEWDSLIAQFTQNTEDSHWSVNDNINGIGLTGSSALGSYSWTQETYRSDISSRARRGHTLVNSHATSLNTATDIFIGYRPVLEVL